MVTPRPNGNGRRRAGAAVLAAIGFVSSSARADGMSLSRFEPSERGSRFFLADSLELDATAAAPLVAAGVTSTYAARTRTFGAPAEAANTRLLEHALYLHPGASVVIQPGARFALDVPIAAFQDGHAQNLAGTAYPAPASPRLGDVRAGFDLHLLGPASRRERGVALAGGVSAWLPTGATDDYAGDLGARFGVHVASAARLGVLIASARAGYMYRRDGALGGSRLGSEVDAVLGLAYDAGGWTLGPELRAATLLYEPFTKRTTPAEVLVGLHRDLGPFRAGLGVGTSLVPGLGAPELRLAFSLEWVPRAAEIASDRDRDGVPDGEDACPDVPGRREAPPEARGCPPPAQDRDHDGILDEEDACPDVPGARSKDPKTHGCPAVPSPDLDPVMRGDDPSPDGPPIQ